MSEEYDIYLPTRKAKGETIDFEILKDLRLKLVDTFGGLTDTRIRNKGFWKSGGVCIDDEIVIWRILSDKGAEGERFLKGLKKNLEDLLEQDKILVVKRQVDYL